MTKQWYKTPEAAHAEAMARGAKCKEEIVKSDGTVETRYCPAWGTRQGPVLQPFKANAKLVIIGQNPGGYEVRNGENFVGDAGDMLNEQLEAGGISRSDCSIGNVVACMMGDSVQEFMLKARYEWKRACKKADAKGEPAPPPPVNPVEACHPRLLWELEQSNAPVVLAVGKLAYEALNKIYKVKAPSFKKQVGCVVDIWAARAGIPALRDNTDQLLESHWEVHPNTRPTSRTRWLRSSYNPGFAKDHKQYTGLIQSHLRRAAENAVRGRPAWTWPNYKLYPTLEDVRDFVARLAEAPFFAADIETDALEVRKANVRCIGMGTSEWGIVVPFIFRDGTRYWPTPAQEEEVRDLVRGLLNTHKRVFYHNGAYDTAVMATPKNHLLDPPVWIQPGRDYDSFEMHGRMWNLHSLKPLVLGQLAEYADSAEVLPDIDFMGKRRAVVYTGDLYALTWWEDSVGIFEVEPLVRIQRNPKKPDEWQRLKVGSENEWEKL